jgi:hypothetical protein
MADILTKLVVDCSTGETTEIPLTADEIADLEAAQAQAETQRQAEADAIAAKEAAKTAAVDKLTKLGLSADEIAALTA